MSAQRALITGITGQDGSYLSEFLLNKGYEVHGIVRRVALEDPHHRLHRLHEVRSRLTLHAASLESYASLHRVIAPVQPHECYHLAAQSFVSYSFDDEFSTFNANINGTHYLLAALKSLAPDCRFYFAGSSEMFGQVERTPQDESTRFHPRSAYGISKVAGFDLTRNYREAYGMHASSGILFNHESPRRGFEFVTRKITDAVARIATGRQDEILLGNLDALRDWGHAREYVQAMWMMLQQPQPGDFVIGTGECHSVREFVEVAFASAGLDYRKHVRITCPSCTRMSCTTLRCPMTGSLMPPRSTSPVTLEMSNSRCIDISPSSWTRTVTSMFTPTSMYVNCVFTRALVAVALVPAE
jgi:GDPmannose 4,6-dehydratase